MTDTKSPDTKPEQIPATPILGDYFPLLAQKLKGDYEIIEEGFDKAFKSMLAGINKDIWDIIGPLIKQYGNNCLSTGFGRLPKVEAEDIANGVKQNPGIYIVGIIKQDLNNQDVFCPLYVGISTNLDGRIGNHYQSKGGYLNQRKEVFRHDITIDLLYDDLYEWNIHWGSVRPKKKRESISNQEDFFYALNNLIWFNTPLFYDNALKMGTTPINRALFNGDERSHDKTINKLLPSIGKHYPHLTGNINTLIGEIKASKANLTANFAYCYCQLAKSRVIYNKCDAQNIEALTKWALERYFGIYTHCDPTGEPAIAIYDNLRKLQAAGLI